MCMYVTSDCCDCAMSFEQKNARGIKRTSVVLMVEREKSVFFISSPKNTCADEKVIRLVRNNSIIFPLVVPFLFYYTDSLDTNNMQNDVLHNLPNYDEF
jgi:hypothetical protein